MKRFTTLMRDRALRACRVVAVAALALICLASHAIREASISSYISAPHAGTSVIMRGGLFAFAGGVIPRGDVVFFDESELPINQGDLALLADVKTGRPYVSWAGQTYQLLIQKSLTCPLARYVQRGTVIAFTIAIVADDPKFLESQGLVQVSPGTYIASDLRTQEELLEAIDLSEGTEPIAQNLQDQILESMNQVVRNSAGTLGVKSRLFVNAFDE